MTPEEAESLSEFEGLVATQQAAVADLIDARAPVPRVQTELNKLKQMELPVTEGMSLLDKLKVAAVRQAVFQLKFQYGEQRDAASELVRGADKTSDAADLDSWDYEDEDAAPPPSAVRGQQKASRLAAFRKRGQ